MRPRARITHPKSQMTGVADLILLVDVKSFHITYPSGLSTRIDPKLQASLSETQLVISRVCSIAESERKLTRT